jgi:hypothetical protein
VEKTTQPNAHSVHTPTSEPKRRSALPQPADPAPANLARLATVINQSSRVQAQRKLAEEIEGGEALRSHAAPGAKAALDAGSSIGKLPHSGVTVVQAKLDNPFEKGPEVTDVAILQIIKEVRIYNEIGGYRITFPISERKQALTQLGKIERLIYTWFGNQRSHDLDVNQINMGMKTLMNSVSFERQSLVELSIGKKDEDPPIANFDELEKPLKEEITLIWRQLLAGKGIQIEGPSTFRIKVLSDFSRLLETKMGRTLAGGILNTGKGLVISPPAMGKGKLVAMPNEPAKEGLEETQEHENFAELDIRDMEEAQRLRLLQHVRMIYPKSPGVSVRSELGVRHFKFGEGTGSTLPVPIDSLDAMPNVNSRMADRYGNEVIAPTFINLGHELGHVLRSAQGISASGAGGGSLLQHSFENPDVSRPEEFFNIGGVENRLRLESGMMERYSHGNLYTHWAVEGMDTIQQITEQIKNKLKEVEAESPAALRLKTLNKKLLELEEPFQLLMNGKGKIDPLLAQLRKLKLEFHFGD